MSAILYSLFVEATAKIWLVTFSGAGAPLERLYLIPKSWSGPKPAISWVRAPWIHIQLTTGVVGGSQQDSSGGTSLADDVRSSGSRQDSVLTNENLLHSVCGCNLGDNLDSLAVVVTSVSTNNEESTLSSLRDRLEEGGDEGLGVVRRLERFDLFTETGTVTFSFRDLPSGLRGELTFRASGPLCTDRLAKLEHNSTAPARLTEGLLNRNSTNAHDDVGVSKQKLHSNKTTLNGNAEALLR
jgi:hypothetical protein